MPLRIDIPNMAFVLAVDPGADTGWAIFDDDTLKVCGMGVGGCMRNGITRAVIEKPMIYPGGRQQARPADVIKLAVRAGEWGGRCESWFGIQAEYVEPFRWKGGIPKDIHHARIWAVLKPTEQAIVADAAKGIAPSKRHNLMDAVGIGLYAVGRKA